MKHVFIILFFTALGTFFLFLSYNLKEDGRIVVSTTPSPTMLKTPESKITPTVSIIPTVTPTPSLIKKEPKVIVTPLPQISPSINPSPTNLALNETGNIVIATKPEKILEEAKIFSGRVDPFTDLAPIPIIQEPKIPEELVKSQKEITTSPTNKYAKVYKSYKKQNYRKHLPLVKTKEPSLKAGLTLTGIIESNDNKVAAILDINGEESKVVYQGDIVGNSISIVLIDPKSKFVVLGKGNKLEKLSINE